MSHCGGTPRKAKQIPVSMRQAPVQAPSTLHEVYTSDAATLSRSKSRIQMVLHDEPVIERPATAQEERPISPAGCAPEICELAEKLKTQVADLSLFLEEERLRHKDTRRRAEEILKDKVAQLKADHNAALDRQTLEYEVKEETLRAEHQHQLMTERLELNNAIAKLKTEIEILNGAFDSYKSQTEVDHKNALEQLTETLTSTLTSEKEQKMQELETLLRYEHNLEINKLEHKQKGKLTELRVEQKKAMEQVKEKYAHHEADLQELKDTREKLEKVSKEFSTTSAKLEEVEQELFDLKMKYGDSRVMLLNKDSRVGEQIMEIEAKYKGENDRLREANSNLRLQYLKKCEELFELSAQTQVDKLTTQSSTLKNCCKRVCRLTKSQSLLELSVLEGRGYTKSLFTQLHVQNLNDDLEWWLSYTGQLSSISHLPVQQIPLHRVYEQLSANNQVTWKSRFPPLPSCHKTKNKETLHKQRQTRRALTMSSQRSQIGTCDYRRTSQ